MQVRHHPHDEQDNRQLGGGVGGGGGEGLGGLHPPRRTGIAGRTSVHVFLQTNHRAFPASFSVCQPKAPL